MIRKILLCICMGGMLVACSEEILPEVTAPSGTEDHAPVADLVFDGTEGLRELQVDVCNVMAGETDGGFLAFVQKDGKSYLYLEQNDEKASRCGNLKLLLADGRTKRYTVEQESRDQTPRDAIDKGLIRNYGVGYSFEGYNGEKCSFNSVRSQVINLQMLREVEEKENDRLLNTDYEHAVYYATSSGYSLSDYVHSVKLEAAAGADLILYKGSLKKTMDVFEVVNKKNFYVSTSYISPKGIRSLETEKLKYYVKEYPELLTHSFRKAVEDLSRHPSDIMALDSFLVRFGSHVVQSSTLGGKLDLYVSVSQESFDTYEEEKLFSENAVALFFKKMKEEGSHYNFKDAFNAAESRMDVSGGRISILNEAVINPDFNNARIQPELLAQWESSIEYDEENYAGNNVEMVDMEVCPIWDLIPDPEVAKYVEARAVGTASRLSEVFGFNHFANASFPVSFDEVRCKMGGKETRVESPYVVNIISAGRYVATVCREWVPEICKDEAVSVAYPIYGRTMDWTGGLCVHQGRVYRVAWRHGRFVVTPEQDVSSGSFYLTAGRLEVQKAENTVYQEAYPVLGYEWPGSISIGGTLSGKDYYETRKFLGHFYLATDKDFSDLPNWRWQTSVPDEVENYREEINGSEGAFRLSGVDLGRSGADNLKDRMVMDDEYEFFWNTSEVNY